MRVTVEACAIVLAGVGALCTILAPKLVLAKEELQRKALIDPSRGECSSGADNGLEAINGDGEVQSDADEAAVADDGDIGGHSGGGYYSRCKTPRGPSIRGSSAQVAPASDAFAIPPSRGKRRSQKSVERRPATPVSRAGPMHSTSRPSSPALLAGEKAGDGDEAKYAGEFESRLEGRVSRPIPLAAGFCTPPARIRRSQSAGSCFDIHHGVCNTPEADIRVRGAQSARAGSFFQAGNDQGQGHSEHRRGRGHHRARDSAAGGSSGGGLTSGGRRPSSDRRSAKPPLSGTSNSSRRSGRRDGSTGGNGGGERGRGSDTGSHISSLSRSSRSASVGRNHCDSSIHAPSSSNTAVLRRSKTSVQDNCSLSPLTLAMNGDNSMMFLGGGTGGSGSTTSATTQDSRKSNSRVGRRTLKRRGSEDSKSGRGRDLDRASSGSGASQHAGRGRRTSAAGSLVMFADSGTRLFCPHCEKEVRVISRRASTTCLWRSS